MEYQANKYALYENQKEIIEGALEERSLGAL